MRFSRNIIKRYSGKTFNEFMEWRRCFRQLRQLKLGISNLFIKFEFDEKETYLF